MSPLELAAAVGRGERAALARAITLVESTNREDRERARKVLAAVVPPQEPARRVAITGSPGVGKSTFIDSLGMQLLAEGHRVAVLAVDPSSTISGGSILGDKSRMARLTAEEGAFIRPSPTGGTLGGVARRTRETISLCEAAGYDVILVETVGVGQSEIDASKLVDCFVLLVLPGSGDELQGIKRGVVELADIICVNKADGDRVKLAERTRGDYAAALTLLRSRSPGWKPAVCAVSATEERGLDSLWSKVEEHRQAIVESGFLEESRRAQRLLWLEVEIQSQLAAAFAESEAAGKLPEIEAAVKDGSISPSAGAADLIARFLADR